MLHPSYTDLMKVVNQDVEEGATKIVNSRYSIVLATAKKSKTYYRRRHAACPCKRRKKSRFLIAIDELNKKGNQDHRRG